MKTFVAVGYQAVDDENAWTVKAEGHHWMFFALETDERPPLEELANAVFVADNAPGEVDGLAAQIRDTIARRALPPMPHHSLSVGDRVRVGLDCVVCAPMGWVHV